MKTALRITLALGCLLPVLLLAGCGTMGGDQESEIPWNTPQPWEGSPMIPGMDRM